MILLEHRGKRPRADQSAYVAPTAVLCGDVEVGEECRVLFGAVLAAEGGPVTLGRRCVVMENAVVRGRPTHPTSLGDSVLVGPHAHVNGATVGSNVFLATGSSVFMGATVGDGAEVRINGVVHVNTAVAVGAVVPIGWVAVGDPAEILPPGEHETIWQIQRDLDFPGTAFGLEREQPGQTLMPEAMRRYAEFFGEHRTDRPV